MAEYYVSSVSGTGGAGTSWGAAKLTIEAGLALATANGDIVYVDSAHSESLGAAANWDCPTAGTAVSVISVDRNGSTTTGHNGWLAGAISTMGVSGAGHSIGSASRDQTLYFYGIEIVCNGGNSSGNSIGIGTSNQNGISITMVDCTTGGGASNGGTISLGATGSASGHMRKITLINHHFNLRSTATSASISLLGAKVLIINMTCSFSGANKTATLFGGSGGQNGQIEIVNSDLSGYDKSGGFYFNRSSKITVVVRNCKLHATPGLLDASAYVTPVTSFTLINTDTGDTQNVFEYHDQFGSLTENASVYADSGAKVGGVNYSWRIVTSADCSEARPFICPWLHRWSDATSSISVGFRIAHDSATDMHNRNLWSEIEYVSDASFPKGTSAISRNAQPFDGSTADWSNDAEAWTGIGGFSNPNTQTVESTFTPAEKSLLRGRLHVGVASKTLYLDPALRITGAGASPPSAWLDGGAFNAEPASASGGPYSHCYIG